MTMRIKSQYFRISSLRIIYTSAILLTCGSAAAQQMFSSPYSVYGVGLLNDHSSSFNRGLGGTGIAVQDDNNLNHQNPASYGSIKSPVSHVFETGLYFESNRLQTKASSESKTNGGLASLSYWFKFNRWWSTAVGIAPFSTVSYNIGLTQTLALGGQASYVYEGSGNITRLYMGNAFNIIKGLSLGVNASYLFGSIKRSETISSTETNGTFTLTDKNFTRAFNLDFGAQYRFELPKNRALILGVVYDNQLKMKGTSELMLYDSNYDTLSVENGEKHVYTLPEYYGSGIAWKSNRSILSADVKFTKWSNASYAEQNGKFRDVTRLSAGYAYLGNTNGESYFSFISFRGGFYVQPYPLDLNNINSKLWGAAVGLSFPVFDGKSSLNFTYNYDQMGTLENGLVLQRSNKFTFDVIIRDFWGIRRKFD